MCQYQIYFERKIEISDESEKSTNISYYYYQVGFLNGLITDSVSYLFRTFNHECY